MSSYADIGLPVYSAPTAPKKSKWSAPKSRTVMPNVACMLPPDLHPDVLRAFLLRFQLGELEYKMNNLEEEMTNINFGESIITQTELRAQVTPDVRARDTLVKERREIADSIERMYPAFCPPLSYRFSMSKSVKRFDLASSRYIGTILGIKGHNLTSLEHDFNVKISIRGPQNFVGQVEDPDATSYILIIGNNDNDVNRCYKRVEELIRTDAGYPGQNAFDYSKIAISFNPDEEIPPWLEGVKVASSSEVTDSDIKDVFRDISNSAKEKGKDGQDTSIMTQEDIQEQEIASHFMIDLSYYDLSRMTTERPPPGDNFNP